MSVTRRVSISWPPTIPASEPTDTVVLSFPSAWFIDIRIGKEDGKLQWGFAGRTVKDGEKTKFIHYIDSRNPSSPLEVKDEGVFEILESGDERETGEMVNPETGKVMAYEEIWHPLEIEKDPEIILLESVGEEKRSWIGRVGGFFSGICDNRGIFSIRRYELRNSSWNKVYEVGKDVWELPLLKNLGQSVKWTVGEEVEVGGRKWTVKVFVDRA